jgi:hypothetical protein
MAHSAKAQLRLAQVSFAAVARGEHRSRHLLRPSKDMNSRPFSHQHAHLARGAEQIDPRIC